MSEIPLFPISQSSWKIITLGEAAALRGGNVQTGPFGSQLHASDYVEDGIPSIMPKNIGDNQIMIDDIARITESDAHRLKKYRVSVGDIVCSRRGDVERRALVRPENEGWLCGTGCLRIRFGKGAVVPEYATFYLGHPIVRNWIVQHAVGATMPNLNTKILSSLPFVLPSFSEQKAIASILSALDNKIELNRQMNKTLEGMAQAIFRDWFVDFGPVRRKLSGIIDPKKIMGDLIEDTTKAKELAELLPNGFKSDGLPEGWEMKAIAEIVETCGGATPSTKNETYWSSPKHFWATPKDLSGANSLALLETRRQISDAGLKRISSGLLPAGTVLLSSRAPIGYLAIAQVPIAVNQGFIALLPNGIVGSEFLYLWCKANMSLITGNANGSTFQEISKKNFRPIASPLPKDNQVFCAFESFVKPLFDQIVLSTKENQTLAETRDFLLPKLMSGEIRVGDIAVETETKLSSVVPIGGDFFDSQSLPANDNQERDSIMVAGVIQVLQKYDGVVGNVKYQKGCYFVYRRMELPTRDFEKQAAGPYNTKIKEGGYRDALANRYIRRARKNGYSGNIPASKISQIDQLILHYGLGEALAWVKTHLKGKNRDELELWATVDYAMVALQNRKITPTADSVRAYINGEPEWTEKLKRAAFSSSKIKQAIIDLNKLFARTVTTL